MTKLRTSILTGIAWSGLSQFIRQIVNFSISVVLARLLLPQEFGLVGMATVFTGFVALFSDLGFSAALIQKETFEERYYSSIFWLNVCAGMVLTVTVASVAPLVAKFYNEPRLMPLIFVLSLNFAISSLSIVQRAKLSREMAFHFLALVDVTTIIISGGTAVVLAFAGYSAWSLIWQTLIGSLTSTLLIWQLTRWRPVFSFERKVVTELFGFSGYVFGFSFFNYWVRNVDYLLIGKYFGPLELGIYTRAYITMLLPVREISGTLGKVMFPALSKVQKEKNYVKQIYLRTIAAIALVTFPLMLGLLVTAEHFVLALYGSQWAAVIPILRILALLGMVQSIVSTLGWIYQSQGRSDWFFLWSIGAGILMIGSIALGVRIGNIKAVAMCYAVASGILLLYPAFAIPGKLINMSFREVLDCLSGVLLCALAMASTVWSMNLLLPLKWSHWTCLIVEVVSGGLLYLALIHIFKVRAYIDVRTLVVHQWNSRHKQKVLVTELAS